MKPLVNEWMAVICVALCLCIPSAYGAEQRTLTLLNWDDYIAPDVVSGFEKHYGVRVNYRTYSSLDEFATLFFDQSQHFDLIFPPSRIINTLASKGLVATLDTERLLLKGDIRPGILNEYASQDNGALNGIPYMWGTTGLGVNRKALAELGVADEDMSWKLLFDPVVRKKAGQCGIGLLNERDELFAAALAYLGHSVNTLKKQELKEAGLLIKESMADITYLHTVQYREDLTNKRICVAVGYSGDLLAAAGDDPDLAYVVPKEGNALWVDVMAIPANAKAPDLAYLFMNYVMKGNVAATNTNYLQYPTPMLSADRYTNPDVLNNPLIYPSVVSLRRMETLAPRDRKTVRVMRKLWVDALCSRGQWCSVPMTSLF